MPSRHVRRITPDEIGSSLSLREILEMLRSAARAQWRVARELL